MMGQTWAAVWIVNGSCCSQELAAEQPSCVCPWRCASARPLHIFQPAYTCTRAKCIRTIRTDINRHPQTRSQHPVGTRPSLRPAGPPARPGSRVSCTAFLGHCAQLPRVQHAAALHAPGARLRGLERHALLFQHAPLALHTRAADALHGSHTTASRHNPCQPTHAILHAKGRCCRATGAVQLTQLPEKPPMSSELATTRWHGTAGAKGLRRSACRAPMSSAGGTRVRQQDP